MGGVGKARFFGRLHISFLCEARFWGGAQLVVGTGLTDTVPVLVLFPVALGGGACISKRVLPNRNPVAPTHTNTVIIVRGLW